MSDWRRSPGTGKYARPERERRFLASAHPVTGSSWRIEDRYIDGTSLRLRRVTADGESVWKLTQKVRSNPDDPASVSITNLYLTIDEYVLLSALPAATLAKTRRECIVDNCRFVIDVFDGGLSGLRLAEIEVDNLADLLPRPPWLGREVTYDDRFSGGCLARTSRDDLAVLLAEVE